MKHYALALIMILLVALVSPSASGAVEEGRRSLHKYKLPDVTLVNQDAERVRLLDLVNSGKPVIVDFIYATCTTICPVLSAGMSSFQRKVGQNEGVLQISFSIDPEYDTPEIMTEYLERYHRKEGWVFLTGSLDDMRAVMAAFDAATTNKMNHRPLTFLKGAGSDEWVRVNGLLSSKELIAEYEKIKDK